MRRESGFSLVELIIVGGIAAAVMAVAARYLSYSLKESANMALRESSLQQMDAMALLIQKDFQRHMPGSTGVELDDTNAAFNAPADGTPKCSDLRIRQTVLGVAPAPNTVQRIEYRTACTGMVIPDPAFRTSINAQLSDACLQGPQITRTVWANEAAGGAGVAVVSPIDLRLSMGVCFRADVLPDFTQVTVELSATYLVNDNVWQTIRKSIVLVKDSMSPDIEILPPR
jgi:type II secretory pathway pseudopilin PulG